jgi:amidohydrolase
VTQVGSWVDAVFDGMVDVRRAIHAHPELAFEEIATTAVISERLRSLGLSQLPCPTPTGAVGRLEGLRPGRCVLLRADIDALPLQEPDVEPFSSARDGVMHACGHDAHVAILLGVAEVLAGHREELSGEFIFVFQPAEESIGGAERMLDGGLLDGHIPDAALGCHVTSELPTGMIAVRPGVSMAAATAFRLQLSGAGGHGALQPRLGNVVLAASRIATRLDDVTSGMSSEGTSCVCSPGMIAGGAAPNVVPVQAEVYGTFRTFSRHQTTEAWHRLEELAAGIGSELDVDVQLQRIGASSPVVNDADVTASLQSTARAVLPDGAVFELPVPVTASDDVAAFLDRVPGCYFFAGAAKGDGTSGPHHSPRFSIDEAVMKSAATVLTASAVELAARGVSSSTTE